MENLKGEVLPTTVSILGRYYEVKRQIIERVRQETGTEPESVSVLITDPVIVHRKLETLKTDLLKEIENKNEIIVHYRDLIEEAYIAMGMYGVDSANSKVRAKLFDVVKTKYNEKS